MRRVTSAEAFAMLEATSSTWPAGCAMCAITARFTPVIASNQHAICVLDRYGARHGHLLVVHRRHVESIAELPWEDYAAMQRLAWEACRALDVVLCPVRSFVASLGSASGRTNSFPHAHVHVIPLHDGDERDRPAAVLTWQNGVVVYDDEEAAALSSELRSAWPSGREA